MSAATVLVGQCGARHHASPAVCTLPAGHAGPHQAHGYGERVLQEWAPGATAGAA